MFHFFAIISALALFEFAAVRYGVDSRNLLQSRNVRD